MAGWLVRVKKEKTQRKEVAWSMDVLLGVSLLWLWLANSTHLLAALGFSTVTEDINLQDVSGQIASFADFNSDKATDILVLNATGQLERFITEEPEVVIECCGYCRLHTQPAPVEY